MAQIISHSGHAQLIHCHHERTIIFCSDLRLQLIIQLILHAFYRVYNCRTKPRNWAKPTTQYRIDLQILLAERDNPVRPRTALQHPSRGDGVVCLSSSPIVILLIRREINHRNSLGVVIPFPSITARSPLTNHSSSANAFFVFTGSL